MMNGKVGRALRDRLARPRLTLQLAVLAMFLTLPALWVGWQFDDHYQRLAMSAPAGGDLKPDEIFSTLKGDPAANKQLMDRGILPWWMPLDFRLSFLRALSVRTMRLDYRLWPDSPALMHLHSLLWLGFLVAAAAVLYRGILGPGWMGGLAGLLFAVDDAHSLPAAWLANRNALLASAFGILCVATHHRWRRERRGRYAVGSAAFLALALSSGEMGLGAAAYLAAYAFFLEREPAGRRILTLLPAGAVLGGWAVLYRALGHGTHGSGLYLDPLHDPAAFARAFLDRAPLLLLGQWSPVPADLAGLVPEGAVRLLWWMAVLFLAALGVVLAPLLRRDREARFWALGMILALLPVSATFPANRLLFFVGLGAMGLLAKFLSAAFPDRTEAADASFRRPFVRVFAWLMVFTHLVLSPLGMPLNAYLPKLTGEPIVRAAATLPEDPALAGQDLVIVNSPDFLLYVSYLPALLRLDHRPLPRHVRALGAGPTSTELRREDARTVVLRSEGGILTGPLGRLFRSRTDPLRPGDRVELTGMTVEVIGVTGDGAPREVRFRFSVPLEDPSLRWVRWEGDGFVATTPPPIGGSVVFPAPRGPLDL